jgi:hypothetical protein
MVASPAASQCVDGPARKRVEAALHYHSGGASNKRTDVFARRSLLTVSAIGLNVSATNPSQVSLRATRRAGVDRHTTRVRSSGLGVCLTMATHYNHTTRTSITSKHVSIVERLVGRHSPTQMGVLGLASRPEPWRPTDTLRVR